MNSARLRRRLRVSPGGMIAVAAVAATLLSACTNLQLIEEMTGIVQEGTNPLADGGNEDYRPAWKEGYPQIVDSATTNTSFTVRFAFEESATAYWGVWHAGTVDSSSADYERLNGDLRIWIDDAPEAGTLAETAVAVGKTAYTASQVYAEEVISGLDPDVAYEIFAVGVATDGTLAPQEGIRRLAATTSNEVAWANVGDAHHISLHISEPAILNGETARFVVRAENLDDTINIGVNGLVEVSADLVNEVTFDVPQYVELVDGRGFSDIVIESTVRGGVQPAEFRIAVDGAHPDEAVDTVDVVDTTGFLPLNPGEAMPDSGNYVVSEGPVTITSLIHLSDSMLVVQPGCDLVFGSAMGIDLEDSSLFILGTETNPVRVFSNSSAVSGERDWMGFDIVTPAGGAPNTRVTMNGVDLVSPGNMSAVGMSSLNVGSVLIQVANSRLEASPTPYVISLMNAAVGLDVEIENSLIVGYTLTTEAPQPFFYTDASGTEQVRIWHNTIRSEAQDAADVGSQIFAWGPAAPIAGSWVFTGNIIGGNLDYVIGGTGNMDDVDQFQCFRNVFWYRQTLWYNGAEPSNSDLVLNPSTTSPGLWPNWTSGFDADFTLSDTPVFPSLGVFDPMDGCLTGGHPNEVGAYANFGYPSGP